MSGQSRVWNAKLVESIKEKIINGDLIQGGTPFSEGDIEFKAADIVYEYNEEEVNEIAKCATDIVYFANTYCKSMTDDGIRNIKLRPYQEKALRAYQENRWIVFLASRQIGKCFFRQTKIRIKLKESEIQAEVPLYVVYYCFQPPKTFLEHLKLSLYKIESFLSEGKIYSTKKLKKALYGTKK